MSFVFEMVNALDLKRYGLNDHVKYWAIDRENSTFIYGGGLAKTFRQQVMDASDFKNDYVFIFGNKEARYEIHLAKGKGTINKAELEQGEAWVYVWDSVLKIIKLENESLESHFDLYGVLKDGLEIFGGGVRNLRTYNFVVKFNF